ncbi:MAG: cytochrome c oxidase assembly protein, partial [Myxococcales bacterium]|nr:cytochrome c oxidase assembly protein [Myxococcales bacterium]
MIPSKSQLQRVTWTLTSLLTAPLTLLTLLAPAVAFAHPSGLPTLKRQADYFVATSADWLFWDFHPSIVIGIGIMTVLYTLGITRWRQRYGWADEIDKRKAWLFYSSMVLLWFTLDGPLHHLSDELLFSAHMIQHLMLQLVWAAMFVYSMPAWLIRPLIKHRFVRAIAHWLTRPTQAFFIFNGVTWLWHFPAMYNLALEAHEWHIVEHLLFMSTAVIFYFPILSPLKELPRPTHGALMMYVFFNMAAMKSLGVFISMQNEVI